MNQAAPNDPLDTSAGDPYHCEEARRELGPSETTPFGYAAESVRARLEGDHSAALSWQQSAASYGPEQGSSEISISLLSEPTLSWVDRTLVARAGWVIPVGVTEEAFGCVDRIVMAAQVRVTTAGGALDEQAEATFEAGPSGLVLGSVQLPLAALAGSFEGSLPVAEPLSPPENPSLLLHFALADEAMAGDLSFFNGDLKSADGSSVANTTPEPIANFPSGMGCGPEYGNGDDQLMRRAAMADALARLNTASPVPASNEAGGSPTLLGLTFENRDDSICRYTDTPVETSLQFPARVELSSEDGSVAGSIDVDVVSLAPLGRVLASASDSSQDPEQMLGLPAAFGIQQPVSMTGYRAGSVEFQSGLAEGGSWGALRAYGLDPSACSADAGAEPAECGSERTQLWGMSWGTAPSDL